MAGRGRGGKTGTLTQEQMQTLGCVGKDVPQVATAPPPTFPPLMNKPVIMQTTTAQNYQILWKEDFLNHLRDSPYYVVPMFQKNRRSEWSDKNSESLKHKAQPEFHYQLMPSELELNANRKRRLDKKPKLVTKKRNIEDTLKALEEKERTEGNDENEDQAKNNTDSEGDEEEPEAEAALDDEMDEENDYGNSYFDNGESYNEDDDNHDDGPIY